MVSFCLSFCLSPSLSFRWVKQDNELSKQAQTPDLGPKLDLGFKEGQTITLNIGVKDLFFFFFFTLSYKRKRLCSYFL